MRTLAKSAIVVFLLITAVLAVGQSLSQGSIEGTVADPSGALVPGATLTATNTATGVKFTAQSNSDGIYRFAVLPVGTYDLQVERQGFGKLQEQGRFAELDRKDSLTAILMAAE